VAIRRAALKDGNRAVGFPTITFPCEMAGNLDVETMIAAMFHVAKYGGIVMLSDFTGESVFPLLLERLNIFTDPQRPMTVTEGIYEINNPDENSPVLVTTNFALTYFIVSGEIEGSKCSLLAADQGLRRSVRAHRLGRRQILRRRRGHVR
jgi:acetyl-CoA decarbonylase/synthase complex subunit gamma